MRDLYELIDGEDLWVIDGPDGPSRLVNGRLRRVHIHDTVYTRPAKAEDSLGTIEIILEEGFLIAGQRYALIPIGDVS